MEYFEFRAMNSAIVLAAEGGTRQVEQGFAVARQYIDESEKRFTRFSADSELAQFNCSAGSWFKASADFFEVVDLAHRLAVQTGGLFDPSILPALKQAGYDQSMDDLRRYGPSEKYSLAKPLKLDFHLLQLDSDTGCIWMPSGMQLDLGGIAKGWIAEQAARRLVRYSTACAVSAGGDMHLIGLPEGETAWIIGLEDPLEPSRDLAYLEVGPGSVTTSSIVKRQWQKDGRKQHHLIDPRTGYPAETDWLSVTVIASHAAQAEVFAKALLISGSKWMDNLTIDDNEITFIAVDKDGNLWGSQNSPDFLSAGGIHVEHEFA